VAARWARLWPRATALASIPFAIGLSACAARAPQSHAPDAGARVVLSGPPLRFLEDRCGPGSLVAVLNGLGDPVTEPELAAAMPKAPGGGVLSLDLVLAARHRGFEAGLVAGDAATLKREIEASRAAILMLRLLNMPGQRRDIYHYVVADGYDPARQLFRLQFGDGQIRWSRLPDLEGSWKPAGHALLYVSRQAPDLAEALRRGVALEAEGKDAEAAAVYREGLSAHPESVRLRVNLGNAEASGGRGPEAEAAYRAALALDANDVDALNNLAWLLIRDPSRLAEAEELATRAAAGPGPEQAQALDTLGRVRLAQGRCDEAARTFERALGGEFPPADPIRATLADGLQAARGCGAGSADNPRR
jgi:tetratricopeptide (TPR) repeat protein